MEKIILIVAALASLGSLLTSGVYAYVALQKLKEPPKDEAWEAALKIYCAKNDGNMDADEFAELYEQLLIFSAVHGKKRSEIIGSLWEELDYLRKTKADKEQNADSMDMRS